MDKIVFLKRKNYAKYRGNSTDGTSRRGGKTYQRLNNKRKKKNHPNFGPTNHPNTSPKQPPVGLGLTSDIGFVENHVMPPPHSTPVID